MIRLLQPPSLEPATHQPPWLERRLFSIRMAFYTAINRLGLPGAIAPMTYTDQLTGDTITIRTSLWYTIVTVNCRDYYFHRLTGKLDGTGTGCL